MNDTNNTAGIRLRDATCCAVLFRKQVHGTFACMASSDVWLQKLVNLPIPPSIGMDVSKGDWCAKIESIHVDLDTGVIEAWTEPDKEIYNDVLHKRKARPISELVQEWIDNGWEI